MRGRRESEEGGGEGPLLPPIARIEALLDLSVVCLPVSAGILRWSSVCVSVWSVCGRGVESKADRAPPSITSGGTHWARSASFWALSSWEGRGHTTRGKGTG